MNRNEAILTLTAAALSNPELCHGDTARIDRTRLDEWFGKHATGITREQITAKQAIDTVLAVLHELETEIGVDF